MRGHLWLNKVASVLGPKVYVALLLKVGILYFILYARFILVLIPLFSSVNTRRNTRFLVYILMLLIIFFIALDSHRFRDFLKPF